MFSYESNEVFLSDYRIEYHFNFYIFDEQNENGFEKLI
jgi:hypothetical protein